MKNCIIVFLLFLGFSSCKTTSIRKALKNQDQEVHIGLLITDTQTGKVLFEHNAHKTFVPASNTKILSLYSSLATLSDSLPAFKYWKQNDTLYVKGTGDPTLLHPDFPASPALEILKNSKTIVLVTQNQLQPHYGVGWAWDDYNDYYQAELTAFPLYGNVVRVKNKEGKLTLSPDYFQNALVPETIPGRNVIRKEYENRFVYNDKVERAAGFSQEIPFKTSWELTADMLSKAISVPVSVQQGTLPQNYSIAYSTPVDTVVRKMMQESDNFLAEQLLIVAGQQLSDTVSTDVSIVHMQKELLSDITETYRWRDGSGLSRYNLFTPTFMVQVLNKMYKTFPQKKLFSYLSIGGKAGTLRNKYKAEVPYVYAKTGSMGGVYNESGFMIAKSGRLLTYSIMKNNFTGSVSENGKKSMELMMKVREQY